MPALGLEAKLIALGIAVLAILGAVAYVIHHERQVGAATVVAASQEAARREGDRRLDQQSENLNEYARLVERQDEAGTRLSDAAGRVRDAAARGRLAPVPPLPPQARPQACPPPPVCRPLCSDGLSTLLLQLLGTPTASDPAARSAPPTTTP